jgi:hypothetical protein
MVGMGFEFDASGGDPGASEGELSLEQMAYLASVLMGGMESVPPEKAESSSDCGCQK